MTIQGTADWQALVSPDIARKLTPGQIDLLNRLARSISPDGFDGLKSWLWRGVEFEIFEHRAYTILCEALGV